jgi:beta-lactamase class A
MRLFRLFALIAAVPALHAQTTLHQQLFSLANEVKGRLYVACSLPNVAIDCALDPHGHPAMQSTFKFPLAIVVLQQVEAGKLSLDQPIRFLTTDRYPGTYSPLQDAHPEANVDLPLRDLLQLSVGKSDNIATDILLRLIGGPPAVQESLDALGFSAIHVRDSERGMHDDFQAQYRNDAEPIAMVGLLRLFADHSPINPEHTQLLNQWMTETASGPQRIKGRLPAGTVVAHKTGTSGSKEGLYPATNDVGLITLPNGQRLAIAIFVGNSIANEATRESVIARAAKAVYDAAVAK